MGERIDIVYRLHRIIAGERPSGPAAFVYDGQAKLHEANGATLAAALEEARGWIDNILDGQNRKRRLRHVGTRQEYARILRSLPIGRHHEAIRAHANAPEHTLTATQLAHAAGYD